MSIRSFSTLAAFFLAAACGGSPPHVEAPSTAETEEPEEAEAEPVAVAKKPVTRKVSYAIPKVEGWNLFYGEALYQAPNKPNRILAAENKEIGGEIEVTAHRTTGSARERAEANRAEIAWRPMQLGDVRSAEDIDLACFDFARESNAGIICWRVYEEAKITLELVGMWPDEVDDEGHAALIQIAVETRAE